MTVRLKLSSSQHNYFTYYYSTAGKVQALDYN